MFLKKLALISSIDLVLLTGKYIIGVKESVRDQLSTKPTKMFPTGNARS
jgi:ribosomal protein L30E